MSRTGNQEQLRVPTLRTGLPFRPGEMPPVFGDTAAALIVDDNDQVAGVLARLLGNNGYHCSVATSGAQARDRLDEKQFALALVDVMMPGESGLELVMHLLDTDPDLAVIVVTGIADPSVAELASFSGTYGFLLKPFVANQVLITVSHAGHRRCLAIQHRLYEQRLSEQLDEQEIELKIARACLEQASNRPTAAGSDEARTLKALLDTASDAIVAIDAHGRVELMNSESTRLFCYGDKELLGIPVELLLPGSTPHIEVLRRAQKVVGPRPPIRTWADLVGQRKDGSRFPAKVALSSIPTETGVLVSVLVRDATEPETLANSDDLPDAVGTRPRPDDEVLPTSMGESALLAAIVESSDDAIIGKTLDGIITSFNSGASRMYGYAADEVIGHNMSLLVPEDRPDELPDILARVGAGERIEPYETKRVRKDHSLLDVSITASPIRDDAGTVVGVSATARDVTARRLLEVARREAAEDRIQSILESSPLVLFSYDMAGRFTSYRAGKLPPEFLARGPELIGRSVFDVHAADPVTSERMRRALRGERVEGEVEVLGHMLDVRYTPELDADGRQIGVNGLSIDISDQVRARDEQLRYAERLHRYERLETMGQLAGGIAHDFNNLLGVIINCTSFVTEELDDHDAARADLAQIERAAERAAQLTRQLLAFARREVLQPQVVDLNVVVTGVEAMLRRTLGEHVILVTKLVPDLWPVMVDPGQFEQVLVNLALNSRDAMSQGGVLAIDTENVEIDDGYRSIRPAVAAGRHVLVRVSDDGTGIEKSVLEHMFEPFFTTKPTGEGTGLGLATVYGTVTQAGGDVQIYSELGFGTTCRVLLPACEEAPAPVVPAGASRPFSGTETVLVVEDEEPLRDVARRILTRRGYTVIVAAGGEEALAALRDHDGPIDLLLTDVVMPHMLGPEVAKRLEEQQPGLRVLFMSGHAHTVLGPILDTSSSLVEKPFTERSLLEKVRAVLDAKR